MPLKGLAWYLGMQQVQRLSHCIEPNLCMSSTEPSRVHAHTYHCSQMLENRVFEPAPRTKARECSETVSTRANALLYATVDLLDGAQ